MLQRSMEEPKCNLNEKGPKWEKQIKFAWGHNYKRQEGERH